MIDSLEIGATARLLGGPDDGRTVTIPDGVLRNGTLLVPVRPELSLTDYDPGGPALAATPRPTVYRWDGTRNDAGEARFRWAP